MSDDKHRPKWAICPACHGEGKSSAFLGTFSAEEFSESFDPDEQEAYVRGEYDRRCERCSGTGKVNEHSEQRNRQRREDLYERWCESGRPEGSFSAWSGE